MASDWLSSTMLSTNVSSSSMSTLAALSLSTLSTTLSAVVDDADGGGRGGNVSRGGWRPSGSGGSMSTGQRARIVLSQPVAVLTLTLCVLSLLANLLSVLATLLAPNGLTTHLKLVVSLSLSDMLLALTTVSHMLNRILNTVPTMSASPDQRLTFACASSFHFALHTMAIVVSLLNLLVMAADHYVAIMNPLHYPARLSRTKGTAIVCVMWLLAFLGGCSVFLADVDAFKKVSHLVNYCEYVQHSEYHGEYLIFPVAFLSFLVISYTYGRIYVEVRRTYRHGSTMDYVRNRKALLTTLLIIGTFVFCWLPTCLFQIALLIQVHVDKAIVRQMYATFLRANRYLNALLLVNSLCDPVIYAFRLRDVQLGYTRLFQRCLFRRRDNHNYKYTSSFRSMSLRTTQTINLTCNDNLNSSGGCNESPPCNTSAFFCDDAKRGEAGSAEAMIQDLNRETSQTLMMGQDFNQRNPFTAEQRCSTPMIVKDRDQHIPLINQHDDETLENGGCSLKSQRTGGQSVRVETGGIGV